MNKKHTYVRNYTTLLANLLKKFPLILTESTGRDRNAIRIMFASYKCIVNNKNKVISSSKKLYRMHLRHLVK